MPQQILRLFAFHLFFMQIYLKKWNAKANVMNNTDVFIENSKSISSIFRTQATNSGNDQNLFQYSMQRTDIWKLLLQIVKQRRI